MTPYNTNSLFGAHQSFLPPGQTETMSKRKYEEYVAGEHITVDHPYYTWVAEVLVLVLVLT